MRFFLLLLTMIFCVSVFGQANTSSELIKTRVNVKYHGISREIPVVAQIDSLKLQKAHANNAPQKIKYITRVLQNNTLGLSAVTKNFTRIKQSVYLFLGVNPDLGHDVHWHGLGHAGTKKICGRICMKNDNKKWCCAIIICPGNCEC